MAAKKKRRAIKKKTAAKKRRPLGEKKPLKEQKRAVKKGAPRRSPAAKKLKQNVIGIVTHYFPRVRAAVVKLKAPLYPGDTVKIKGHTTDFVQKVVSMQINRVPVSSAKKGDEIGLLVDSRVRARDIVSKE